MAPVLKRGLTQLLGEIAFNIYINYLAASTENSLAKCILKCSRKCLINIFFNTELGAESECPWSLKLEIRNNSLWQFTV